MLINKDRILQLLFGCIEIIPNQKLELKNLKKFQEFLEKLSAFKNVLLTEINISTYLHFIYFFNYQPLLITFIYVLKFNILIKIYMLVKLYN